MVPCDLGGESVAHGQIDDVPVGVVRTGCRVASCVVLISVVRYSLLAGPREVVCQVDVGISRVTGIHTPAGVVPLAVGESLASLTGSVELCRGI